VHWYNPKNKRPEDVSAPSTDEEPAPGESSREGRPKIRETGREPIAIIGIGCRFPGARGPEAFWRLLREGADAITEIPPYRFDVEDVYDPRPGIPGKINTRWGGFLEGVDEFDPYFFGISSREAAAMDPQQRVMLEVSWEAIEDAGLVPEDLDAGQTGVFVGTCNNDYVDLLEDPADIDIYFAGGNALSVLSGRLSYVLGLQGPSITVDTACSTSLVAVHLACQSLWSRESTVALAGGVNLILSPKPYMGFSGAQMLASDGRCKFGDSRADGFVRSDGAGVVVLKRLSSALPDGDTVYAVIRGSAVNNDGDSGGLLMTPSRPGQEAVFKEAYRSAGVSPGEVQYVEVHGTGTPVGDPVEVQALGAVIGEGRSEDSPCVVGSVKTNIGHAEGAAGVAGLIKVALALKHETIPPSLHLREPNPNIPWQDLPLRVQRELGPWPASPRPARAGVSSFGISGTNAHVVLEEAPEDPPAETEAAETEAADTEATATAHVLPLSAHSTETLEGATRAYLEFLRVGEGAASLQDVCYTAGARRTHHDHRLAVVGSSQEELAKRLESFLGGEPSPGLFSGRRVPGRRPKLAFVFSGQGSQWVGMGQELLEQEPVFREALERCDEAMRGYVDWSLIEELTADEGQSRLEEVDVIQPAIFAVQVALAALWRSWGVEPDAVVGQSMGEVAAAHVAGALSLDDAARIICRRSQLVKRTSGRGGMAAVALSLEEAQRVLAGYEDRVSVGVSSSPSSTVLSGDTGALEEILARLEERGTFWRWIKVDYASHSPQVEPLRPELLQAVESVQPRPSSVPIYSTVTGESGDGRNFDAAYWVENLRRPVLFSGAVERLARDGHDLFLEVSPHPVLLGAVEQGLRHLGREGRTLPSLREGTGRTVMLESFGALYCVGHPVNWDGIGRPGSRCVRLPFYPWQRERFWFEGTGAGNGWKKPVARRNGKGHLLGMHLRSAAESGTHFWEMNLNTRLLPYLADHRVQGLAVLPATAYVEMALAAAAEVFGPGSHVVEALEFSKALFLPEDREGAVQLVVSPGTAGDASFQLFSPPAGEADGEPWTLHAGGTIRPDRTAINAPEHESPEEVRARCEEEVSAEELYEAMEEHGLQYGPSFRGVERIWRRDGEAIGRLRVPETVTSEAAAYSIHPAVLDACFQVLAATLTEDSAAEGTVYLPVRIDELRLYGDPAAELWSHALLRPEAGEAISGRQEGDVFLLDEEGRTILEARGLRLQALEADSGSAAAEEDFDSWLYEVRWRTMASLPQEAPVPEEEGSWLIFADKEDGVGRGLRELLEEHGERCVIVFSGEAYRKKGADCYELDAASPEDFQGLLTDALGPEEPPLRAVVHLWGLDEPRSGESTLDSLELSALKGCIGGLHLVQALVRTQTEAGGSKFPRLWLVTRRSQDAGDATADAVEPVAVAQAPLWGLGKVVSIELPELRCTKVDLDSAGGSEEVRALFQELWLGGEENQVALRGGTRYAPRLVRYAPEKGEEEKKTVSGEEPFRLEVSKPGILDALVLRETTRREPAPGEVEIRVRAVGLNFRDVLMAMGLVPPVVGLSVEVGFECAGEISAVGEGVEGLEVGDGVVAFASGCLSSFVTTSASFVMPKPERLSFEEAATVPIAFFTAHYALSELGRLAEGERVLIHAAAGGVGQAAVRIAQRVGAEIFATAGSPEKREFLRSMGIEHVMDSRSLDFAGEVMGLTGGEGVDVVLNSLAGEFIPKSLSTLRPGGRFLEIGKVDFLRNTRLDLGLLQHNVSFFAIDLSQMMLRQPDLSRSLLREAMRYFEEGELALLPFETFPISQAVDAFRHMAQAKHIGKVVVSLDEGEVRVVPRAREPVVSPDGTYLVTGGLGGLGLTVARWLVEQGARHLVLMGRSAPSAAAREVLNELEGAGVRVEVSAADVAREEQVAGVLDAARRRLPPLRGVVHAAGVLDDGILTQQTRARFETVMAPKVSGAWNLHRLTLGTELDFFVLFSSGASVLGSPGQANYVAANAFLDALAHHRRAVGLPAVSINWGAWAEVGLATREDRAQHLSNQGLVAFTPEQGSRLLGRILELNPVQVMAAAVDWSRLLGAYSSPLLSELAEEAEGSASPGPKRKGDGLTREKLRAAPPEERRPLVESFLVEQLAEVLRCSPSKVDLHQSLNRLGIDSLMAVELKTRVEADLETSVPVTMLLEGPSLSQLAAQLLEGLDAPAAADALSAPAPEEADDGLEAQVQGLSDEEVDALLRDLAEEEEEAQR
jgi:acyl transferase domain-containing protein/acyl carrier protein